MSEPEFVYYNAVIASGLRTTNSIFKADYSETRTQPIIKDPYNYKMSIINAVIPGQIIPIKVIRVERDLFLNPSKNIDMTVYRVKLSALGSTAEIPIYWITQKPSAPVPISLPINPINTQYADYYSLYNHSYMIKLINIALNSAFNELKRLQPTLRSTEPPLFKLNKDGIITFIVQSTYEIDNIKLSFNGTCYRFFSGIFPTIFGPGNNNFIIINYDITNRITLIDGIEAIINTGDFNNLSLWNSSGGFRSIEIVSNTLPIFPESINTQDPFLGRTADGGNNFDHIICDFRLDNYTGFDTVKSNIVYQPAAQYRYCSFIKSPGSLVNINFSIRWKDDYGNTYPVYILDGMTATIKFLFERIN